MRNNNLRYLAMATMLFTLSAGCNHTDKPENAANTNATAKSSGDAGSAVQGASTSSGTVPVEPGEALILRPFKDVSIKVKGAQGFIRIIASTPFRSGDTLQIGADSKALIFCKDVCELTMGTYTSCCTDDCKVTARIHRTSPEPLRMLKKDLPSEDAVAFADAESKLQRLGLGEITTQFLKASLYSSWGVTEADAEVTALSKLLDKPEASVELDKIYTTVTRKTGDLFVMVDQKDKARFEYEKAVKPRSQAMEWKSVQLEEKATAHERLGEIYKENGNKAAADANFKAAKSIYVERGDRNKAAVIDGKMKVKRAVAKP